MIKLWRVLLLVVLLSVYPTVVFAAGFSGTWECDKVIWQFRLNLSAEGNSLTGKHYSSREYGNRIDSSGDIISIQGVVSGNTALVSWKSGYNYAEGKATITIIDDNTIRWKRTEVTVPQAHYIPEDVTLKRVIPNAPSASPAPWGPDDMILLHRTAKPSELTLNGSLDKAISMLGQPKSKEPFYWEGEPSGYEYRWDDTIVVVGTKGKFILVGTNGTSLLTARGIGRGAYPSHVERVYGKPTRIWHNRDDYGRLHWTYHHQDGGRLIFGFDDVGRVRYFEYTILPGL